MRSLRSFYAVSVEKKDWLIRKKTEVYICLQNSIGNVILMNPQTLRLHLDLLIFLFEKNSELKQLP